MAVNETNVMTEIAYLRFYSAITMLRQLRLISQKVYYIYLVCLFELLDFDDKHRSMFESIINAFPESREEATCFIKNGDLLTNKLENYINENKIVAVYEEPYRSPDEDGKDLQLYSEWSGWTGQQWEFHEYDDDPNPSIPHGHSYHKSCKEVKLDVYTRAIYQKKDGKFIGHREDKKKICALWNDDKFYEFFKVIFNYYIQKGYKFKVNHPLRRPRIYKH